MKNENGSVINWESENISWEYVFPVFMPPVYLSAHNTGPSDKTIRATIYKSGVIFKSAEHSGPYTIVTVQGTL
jgi:hypothetical protein